MSEYTEWSKAGGPNECKHGYAEGIPCQQCDENKRRQIEDLKIFQEKIKPLLEHIKEKGQSELAAAKAVCEAECNQNFRLIKMCEDLKKQLSETQAKLEEAEHSFKNFHRLLCERFDYGHDQRDWKRDQLSLIEWIAKKKEAQDKVIESIRNVVRGVDAQIIDGVVDFYDDIQEIKAFLEEVGKI